jgi:AcrR family transcriptional regulator
MSEVEPVTDDPRTIDERAPLTLGEHAEQLPTADSEASRLHVHRQRMMVGLAEAVREKGLAQTQITDIVRHAGASRRTFYRCFPDKESCFIALAESLFTVARAEVEAAVDVTQTPQVQVDAAVDVFLAILAADPVLVSAFKNDLPMLGERGVRIQRESLDRYAAMLVRLTSTPLMREAKIGPVQYEVALMVMSGFDGVVGHAIAEGRSVVELAPLIKDLFRRVLLP